MNSQFKEYWQETETDLNTTYSYAALHAIALSTWATAYKAGMERAAEIAESDVQTHAVTITQGQMDTHNQACRYLANAIRKEAEK